MMKIIVIYDSKTGNTEKMANAIADGANQNADVEIMKIGEAFPLTIMADADGAIVAVVVASLAASWRVRVHSSEPQIRDDSAYFL